MIDRFRFPDVVYNGGIPTVTADVTVQLGALAQKLFAFNYRTSLFLSKDSTLDPNRDFLWATLNPEGTPDGSVLLWITRDDIC